MPVPSVQNSVPKTFRPIGNKVLVRRLPTPDMLDGIVLPGNYIKVGLAKGEVLAAGPKAHGIEKGNTVFFPVQLGYPKVDYAGANAEVLPYDSICAVSP